MSHQSLDAGGEDEGAVWALSNQDEVAIRRVEQVAPMSLKGKMREYHCQGDRLTGRTHTQGSK